MRQIEIGNDEVLIALSAGDLAMLIGAIRETNEALEDWEFETRTGFERQQMHAMQTSLVELLKKMQP